MPSHTILPRNSKIKKNLIDKQTINLVYIVNKKNKTLKIKRQYQQRQNNPPYCKRGCTKAILIDHCILPIRPTISFLIVKYILEYFLL